MEVDHVLTVEKLTRRYGDLTVVDGVDFTVGRGEVVGFVGANGAGKTTTMRMILGVLAWHSGRVLWNGDDVTGAHRRRFGYLPEERGLYPKQAIREQLVYLGRLGGQSKSAACAKADALLGELGLTQRAKAPLESLSLGNQQRVQVAAANMNDPLALILDEPFSGLDPISIEVMADMLSRSVRRGVAVLFSSHQLDLVERLCDRVVVLHNGRVVADGAPDALRAGDNNLFRIRLDADAGWLRSEPGIEVLDVDGAHAIVRLDTWTTDDLICAALRKGTVRELHHVRPSLTEVFKEVTDVAAA